MEGKKGGFFVLISIVGVLSVSLAFLSIYVFFMAGNTAEKAQAKEIVVPKDSELTSEQLFDENTAFNLKLSKGDSEEHVLLVNIQIQYFTKHDVIKAPAEKISLNKSKLCEIVGSYFQDLTIDDVMASAGKEKARSDLKRLMNEYLVQNEKKDDDLVYSIIFDYWFYQ